MDIEVLTGIFHHRIGICHDLSSGLRAKKDALSWSGFMPMAVTKDFQIFSDSSPSKKQLKS